MSTRTNRHDDGDDDSEASFELEDDVNVTAAAPGVRGASKRGPPTPTQSFELLDATFTLASSATVISFLGSPPSTASHTIRRKSQHSNEQTLVTSLRETKCAATNDAESASAQHAELCVATSAALEHNDSVVHRDSVGGVETQSKLTVCPLHVCSESLAESVEVPQGLTSLADAAHETSESPGMASAQHSHSTRKRSVVVRDVAEPCNSTPSAALADAEPTALHPSILLPSQEAIRSETPHVGVAHDDRPDGADARPPLMLRVPSFYSVSGVATEHLRTSASEDLSPLLQTPVLSCGGFLKEAAVGSGAFAAPRGHHRHSLPKRHGSVDTLDGSLTEETSVAAAPSLLHFTNGSLSGAPNESELRSLSAMSPTGGSRKAMVSSMTSRTSPQFLQLHEMLSPKSRNQCYVVNGADDFLASLTAVSPTLSGVPAALRSGGILHRSSIGGSVKGRHVTQEPIILFPQRRRQDSSASASGVYGGDASSWCFSAAAPAGCVGGASVTSTFTATSDAQVDLIGSNAALQCANIIMLEVEELCEREGLCRCEVESLCAWMQPPAIQHPLLSLPCPDSAAAQLLKHVNDIAQDLFCEFVSVRCHVLAESQMLQRLVVERSEGLVFCTTVETFFRRSLELDEADCLRRVITVRLDDEEVHRCMQDEAAQRIALSEHAQRSSHHAVLLSLQLQQVYMELSALEAETARCLVIDINRAEAICRDAIRTVFDTHRLAALEQDEQLQREALSAFLLLHQEHLVTSVEHFLQCDAMRNSAVIQFECDELAVRAFLQLQHKRSREVLMSDTCVKLEELDRLQVLRVEMQSVSWLQLLADEARARYSLAQLSSTMTHEIACVMQVSGRVVPAEVNHRAAIISLTQAAGERLMSTLNSHWLVVVSEHCSRQHCIQRKDVVFLEISESRARERLAIRCQSIVSQIEDTYATALYYLRRVLPFWLACSGVPSLYAAGSRGSSMTETFECSTKTANVPNVIATRITRWGTCFSDAWCFQSPAARLRRSLCRLRAARKRWLSLAGAKATSRRDMETAVYQRLLSIAATRRVEVPHPQQTLQRRLIVMSSSTSAMRRSLSSHHMRKSGEASKAFGGGCRSKSILWGRAFKTWPSKWYMRARRDRPLTPGRFLHHHRDAVDGRSCGTWQSNARNKSAAVTFVRSPTHRLRVWLTVARNASRSQLLSLCRDDTPLGGRHVASFTSVAVPTRIDAQRQVERCAPVRDSVYRKPLICIQAFARARLAQSAAASRRSLECSARFVGAVRSVVSHYDALQSYSSELEGAVQSLLRKRLASAQREAATSITDAHKSAARCTAASIVHAPSVEAIYDASVYPRKDAYIRAQRRPFSAGKWMPPRCLGVSARLDSGSAVSHSRPSSASSARSSTPIPRSAPAASDALLMLESLDDATRHFAQRVTERIRFSRK